MPAETNGIINWITDQADILNNIAANMLPVQRLITGGAYVVGIFFAIKALTCLKEMGETKSSMSASHKGIKEPLIYLLVAVVFIYFPSAIDVSMMTTFGSTNILQYAPVDSSNNAINSLFGSGSSVGKPLTLIIQTIGLAAFIRGWLLISRAASGGQQGGTGKGLVHVFGGIAAINIVQTINIINNTIYGS